MSDRVVTELDDNVLTITLDDPERQNPLSREDYVAMYDALVAARDTDARCVVLQGAGDAFSSGFDMEAGVDEEEIHSVHDDIERIQAYEHTLAREIVTNPLPTVAKIDGPAIGDAAAFALACDIPLASERARIGFSHVRFGISMDCGASWLLPRLVGRGLAMEMALTGDIIDGKRAKEYGLVNHVFPDNEFEERADEIVEKIGSGPPIALEHIKRLIRDGINSDIDEALMNEAVSQAIMFDTEDRQEGKEAIIEGREPEFVGR